MCGFIGLIRHIPESLEQHQKERFQKQNDLIEHRGPDDEGYYHDEYISFGFRRLSIIDIDSGQQPLSYENERYWIVFNGEIYNYVELKETLQKDQLGFETESDTEVIAAMFHKYREKAFQHLRGMFAVLIWDKEEQTLYGARDPFGIKPVYYYEHEDGVYFASEKKSIGYLLEKEKVDLQALQHYFSFQYVPEPFTLTEGIQKVEPGHYFTVKPGGRYPLPDISMPRSNQLFRLLKTGCIKFGKFYLIQLRYICEVMYLLVHFYLAGLIQHSSLHWPVK